MGGATAPGQWAAGTMMPVERKAGTMMPVERKAGHAFCGYKLLRQMGVKGMLPGSIDDNGGNNGNS